MSAEAGGSGGTCDEEDRKSKRTKYSNDDKKPSSGPGMSDAELDSLHMFAEREGGNDLDALIRQQRFFDRLGEQQVLQNSAKGSLNKKPSSGPGMSDAELAAFLHTLPKGTSALNQQLLLLQLREQKALQKSAKDESSDEDSGEEFIFALEISDRNRLVIPYAMACHRFPPMEIQPDSQETLHLYDPQGRRWIMTLIYDTPAHAYVLTNGLNNYLEHNRLNPPDVIRVYRPVPQLKITDFYIQHQKRLGTSLFHVRVPLSNWLRIPCEKAKNYFSPSGQCPDHNQRVPLNLTDYLNRSWNMRYVWFEEEDAYVLIQGWEEYVAHHGLSHKDKIRFFGIEYRHNSIPQPNCFIVHHELRRRVGSVMIGNAAAPLLFPWKNLFFQQRLLAADIEPQGLETVKLEMPGLKKPSSFLGVEMVKLTDVNHKDWYVKIVFPEVSRKYTILDGWEGIVREHNLEAGDMVRLYEPVDSNHDKHFLIECAKKKKTEKEEGGSGSGKPDNGAGTSCK